MPQVVLAGAFTLILSFASVASSVAATVLVPDEVPTIQAAIDSGADTVLVRQGEYHETPKIEGRSVVLRSLSLEASHERPTLAGLVLVFHQMDHYGGSVHVEGLRIRGPVVSQYIAYETRFIGCQLDSTTTIESGSFDCWLNVTRCTFGSGVRLSAKGVTADSNVVRGFLNVTSGYSQARWNVVEGPTSGISVISYSHVDDPAVGNTIRGGTGLEVSCDGEFEVNGNLIEDCSGTGIRVPNASDRVRIRDNVVRRCGAGISMRSAAPEVFGNTVESCAGIGIDLRSTHGTIQVTGNRVARCGGDGLFLSAGGDMVSVSGNIVGRNGRDGIHVARSEPAHLHHNTVFSNARNGIFIEYASSLLSVDHNIVCGNTDAGLAADHSEFPPDLSCNNWFGNGTNEGAATDLSVEPLFCDLSMDDVHLRANSPMLSAGPCGLIGALGVGCDVSTRVLISRFVAERVAEGARIEWELESALLAGHVHLERGDSRDGPWLLIRSDVRFIGAALDREARQDRRYWYRLVEILNGGAQALGEAVELQASERLGFALLALSPSPIVGRTSIHFTVGRSSQVELDVLDPQGRLVATLTQGWRAPGRHTVDWEPANVRPGVYLVRYRFREGEISRRAAVLR